MSAAAKPTAVVFINAATGTSLMSASSLFNQAAKSPVNCGISVCVIVFALSFHNGVASDGAGLLGCLQRGLGFLIFGASALFFGYRSALKYIVNHSMGSKGGENVWQLRTLLKSAEILHKRK
jgi:hypothetical protein